MDYASQRVENMVGKGENAVIQYFLLFSQCFQEPYKSGLCGKGLKKKKESNNYKWMPMLGLSCLIFKKRNKKYFDSYLITVYNCMNSTERNLYKFEENNFSKTKTLKTV